MICIVATCNIKVHLLCFIQVPKEIKISVKRIDFLKEKNKSTKMSVQNMGRWNMVHFNKHSQLIGLNQSYVLVSAVSHRNKLEHVKM